MTWRQTPCIVGRSTVSFFEKTVQTFVFFDLPKKGAQTKKKGSTYRIPRRNFEFPRPPKGAQEAQKDAQSRFGVTRRGSQGKRRTLYSTTRCSITMCLEARPCCPISCT